MPNFDPHMPRVDSVDNADEVFAKARAMACASDENGRSPIVVTPSHRILMPLASIRPGSKSRESVQQIESLIPPNPPQKITVIALNSVETIMGDLWKQSIPFAGYLLGFAYVGHSVVITEGHSSILPAALKDVDILIVDGGMAPFLQADWPQVVQRAGVKRIMIFGRDGSLKQMMRQPNAIPPASAVIVPPSSSAEAPGSLQPMPVTQPAARESPNRSSNPAKPCWKLW